MGVPGRIGDIQPFAELNRGAATIVYKGYQRSLGRTVLLKLLRPEYSNDEAVARRFESEAHLVAKIQHPNVVTIYDYGCEEDRVYFVTEFVEGFDLAALIRRYGALPLDLAAYILREAVSGLQAAHHENILHRDIKPSNILISAHGQVKLTDFGMASFTSTEACGEVRGTPGYLAPEQIVNNSTGTASDLFALGATFYEMLAGQPAYPGSTTNDRINALLNRDPFPALELSRPLPEDLMELLKRLLAKAPDDRYADTGAVLNALNNIHLQKNLAGAKEMQAYLEAPDEYESMQDAAAITARKRSGEEAKKEQPGRIDSTLYEKFRFFPRTGKMFAAVVAVLVVGYAGYLSFTGDRGAAATDPFESLPIIPEDSARFLNLQADQNGTAGQGQRDGFRGETGGSSRRGNGSFASDSLAEKGSLAITSAPPAYVYVNGDSLGTTPLNEPMQLPAGAYRLVLRRPGFPVYRDSVIIDPGQQRTVDVSLLSMVGQLYLQISPWAYVYLDGTLRDTIPPQAGPLIVSPGEHTLVLKNEFGRIDTTIQLTAGEVQHLEFIFQEHTQ